MKKYILEVIQNDDGGLGIHSTCEGFNGLELMGLLAWKQQDIQNQMFGDIKPDIVTRKLIKEEEVMERNS